MSLLGIYVRLERELRFLNLNALGLVSRGNGRPFAATYYAWLSSNGRRRSCTWS